MSKYELWVNMNYWWGDRQINKRTNRQTHQYYDSAWPKGRAK